MAGAEEGNLDEFFKNELSAGQRIRIAGAYVDMWEPYRLSSEQWAPNCHIVHDKFHVTGKRHELNQLIEEQGTVHQGLSLDCEIVDDGNPYRHSHKNHVNYTPVDSR